MERRDEYRGHVERWDNEIRGTLMCVRPNISSSQPRPSRFATPQYSSALMHSPPLRVESCCQTPSVAPAMMYGAPVFQFWPRLAGHPPYAFIGHALIEFLMNFTEPSPKAQLAPPG